MSHTSISDIIKIVANSTLEQLTTKPDLYCSPKNYELILEASKEKDSEIYLIDGIPHYNGYRLIAFNHPSLE